MDSRTEKIQNIFQITWSETLEFYDELLTHEQWSFLAGIRAFVTELQISGFDKKLRIGTSIHRLIFSRSIEHGLRVDQKRILIEPYENGKYDIKFCDFTSPGNNKYNYDEFTTDSLAGNERLLNNLKKLSYALVD